MTDYHALFFVASFLIFLFLSVIFVAPLAILQLVRVCKPAAKGGTVVTIIIGICTSIACICFACTIATLSVFSYIPFWAAAILISAFIILIFIAFKPWKSGFFKKKSNIYLIVVLVFMFIIWWIICALTRDACVTSSPYTVSVYQTRKNSGDMCDKGAPKPCHVYLTFGTNTSTSAIVHFHTSKRMNAPIVRYGLNISVPLMVQATGHKMDLEITRYVYYAELSGLEPDTIYHFDAGNAEDPTSFAAMRKFRTAPTSGPFKFVTGGDLGTGPKTAKLVKGAAQHEPLYMALGGDIAYANAFRSCYQRWDKWFSIYIENALTPSGLTIPIIASVGNHEAGGFDQPLSHLRYYTRYFVQESLNGREPHKLPTHHVKYISNQVLVSLDSNVVETPASQVDFATSALSSTPPGTFKTAMYHAPAYPSVRAFKDPESAVVRKSFIPVFDAQQLAVSFENHDHAYKRSHLLKNGNTDPTGTLYIGDGAMGVEPRIPASEPIPSDKAYLAKRLGRSFYILVDVMPAAYNLTAYDENAASFDTFSGTY